MNILEATLRQRDEVVALLQSQKLPFEDLPPLLQNFYVALEGQKVVGLIGMERYGSVGLLRSMVVHPNCRNKGIAEKLVQVLEEKARAAGIHSIYLLTETAEKYFNRKGYTKIDRKEAPEALMQSSEFSHVCPVSAAVMKKELLQQPVTASP